MMNKETIKEFLKPTIFKIFLFAIISLLAVFVGSNFFEYIAWLKSEIRTITFYPEFNSFFWFPLLELMQDSLFRIFSQGRVKEMILPLLANIVYWYFLSCLIIFAYNKFRKKK